MLPVIYEQANCIQCKMTKREFDKLGLSYEVINLDEEPREREKLKGMGYYQAPVVMTDERVWSGFRPDKIKAYKEGEFL